MLINISLNLVIYVSKCDSEEVLLEMADKYIHVKHYYSKGLFQLLQVLEEAYGKATLFSLRERERTRIHRVVLMVIIYVKRRARCMVLFCSIITMLFKPWTSLRRRAMCTW